MRWSDILNIIKAARFERSLIPISYIMIPVAIINKINLDIFLLMISCTLMYAVGGLINAKVDEDYPTKYLTITSWVFLFTAITISLHNLIITITILISFIIGFIYNKYSRHILFGDSLALATTHIAIPMISSALILGIFSKIMTLTPYLMLALAIITPMKNLNGVEADKKRKYKTLMTILKNGKTPTHILMKLYFIVAFSAFFFFNLTKKFLIIIVILFFIQIIMDICMTSKKEVEAYGLVRLVIISLPFAFVFDKAINPILPLISLTFINIYFTYYIIKFRTIQTNGI